jgi:hypothetical protein
MYWFEYSTDSTFTTSVVRDTTITDTVKSVTGLNAFTKYYWRVKAKNQVGWGTFSDVFRFRTLQNLLVNLSVCLEGFWDGITHISDTLKIFLAIPVYPYSIMDSSLAVLSEAGTSSLAFTKVQNGIYYLILRHRNHLETWSNLPQIMTYNVILNYNFTIADSMAYGNNMKFIEGKWCLYSGDCADADGTRGLQDGLIDANDMAVVDNDSYNYLTGWEVTDLNGDLLIDLNDMAIIDNNAFNYIQVVRPPDAPKKLMKKNPGMIIIKMKK